MMILLAVSSRPWRKMRMLTSSRSSNTRRSPRSRIPRHETDLIVRVPVDAKGEAETLQAANDAGYDTTPAEVPALQGRPLHADRYDLYKLQRIRKTLAQRFWSALFQQNPVPDDGMYFAGPVSPQRVPASTGSNVISRSISQSRRSSRTITPLARSGCRTVTTCCMSLK